MNARDALEVVRLLAGGCGDLDHAHTSGKVPEAIAVLTNLVERAGEPVAGYVNGYMPRQQAIEIRTDAPIPDWISQFPKVRVAILRLEDTAPGASHER